MSSLHESTFTNHLALPEQNRNQKFSPLNISEKNTRGRDGRGGVNFASRQGSRGISHEEERDNEEIQYIKIQQKNQTQTQFFQAAQISLSRDDPLLHSVDGQRERDQLKTPMSSLDQAESIKILESNLNTIKDIESTKAKPALLKTDLSQPFNKKPQDQTSQYSKSIGMQALGSENFGVPISTSHNVPMAPTNGQQNILGQSCSPILNPLPQISRKFTNKDKANKKSKLATATKRSSAAILASHRTKSQRKQSEDEEKRKRDEVLKELEVFNEECQSSQVQGIEIQEPPILTDYSILQNNNGQIQQLLMEEGIVGEGDEDDEEDTSDQI